MTDSLISNEVNKMVLHSLLCPHAGCGNKNEVDDKEIAIALYNANVSTHAVASGGVAQSKAKKLNRPKVNQGMLEEQWGSFTLQWELYKEGTNLSEGEAAPRMLRAGAAGVCAESGP